MTKTTSSLCKCEVIRFYLILALLTLTCLLPVEITAQSYCDPIVTGNTGQGITRFQLDIINHFSPAGEGMRDTNLTKAAGIATVVNGQMIQAQVDMPLPAVITVFIDYNRDGSFAGETVGIFNGSAGTNILNLNIGATAVVTGVTRLRIAAGSTTISEDPCFANVPDGDVEDYLVNVININMQHDSTVVTQPQPCCMYPGKVRKEIIGIHIYVSGKLNPFDLTDFVFSTAGTTNMGDISKAEVWYVGTRENNPAPPSYLYTNLSNRALFGTVNNPTAPTYTVTGNMALTPNVAGPTAYHFLLCYDIAPAATPGNSIDAACPQIRVDSSGFSLGKTPVITTVAGVHTIETPASYNPTNRANVWYFGENAGLDFNCSPPKATADGRMSSSETCATISDPQGNLKFYTNGERIWNWNHEIMANGTGLKGNYLVSTGSIIIPDPGNANEYYVFTTKQGYDTLFYSKVDMSQNGGLGAVTAKNIFVDKDIQEIKAAVHHCNGKDVWLAALKKTGANFNLRTFLISAAGIQPPVVNNAYIFAGNNTYPGTQVFSPNGLKFAFRNWEATGLTTVYVIDFDNSTGVFCDTLKINMDSTVSGLSFSPDNSKLYIIAGVGVKGIFQFDMNTGSKNAIRASKTLIATLNGVFQSAMQTGPDKKIYINQIGSLNGNINSEVLHVINQPNASGAACNFQLNAVNLASRKAIYQCNFPKFIDSYFLDPAYTPFESVFTADSIACDGDVISFSNSSIPSGHTCATGPSYSWDFGDPASGGNNTSTLLNPTHIFSAPGNYTVSLILQERCMSDTAQKQIIVYPYPVAAISGSDSVCNGKSLTLSAVGTGSYLWSTGATTSSISVSPTLQTAYSVTVSVGSCTDSSTHLLHVNPSPSLSISSSAITVCKGDSITLTASGGSTYSWSTGSSSGIITTSPVITTTYTAISSIGSCKDTADIVIDVTAVPVAQAGADDTICEGESILLDGSASVGGTSILWSNGSSALQVSVSPASDSVFSLIVYNGACSDTDAVRILVNPLPNVTASPDISIAAGDAATLSVSTVTGATYSWQPPDGLSCTNCPEPVASPPNTTTYYVTVTDSNGCVDVDTITVTVDIQCAGIYVPNAFSPNNDGQNDVFSVKGNCFSSLYLVIYDRWGEIVFKTNNPAFKWEGSFEDKPLNSNIFTYILNGTLYTGDSVELKGNISLIR